MLSALLRIPLEQVEGGPNARGDVGDVTELAMSIRALGMQKPLLVCDLGEGRYQVLDGHRRLEAARALGLAHVDAVLRRDAGPALRIQQQLALHAQGKAFDPIAEARALSSLMFDHGMTREDIARVVGKSPGWVRDRIALLQLEGDEQESVRKGTTTVGTALTTIAVRRAFREGRAGWAARSEKAAVTATPPARPEPHCLTCKCQEVA